MKSRMHRHHGGHAHAAPVLQEHVILLHGIWMRGITLQQLARLLRRGGYSVDTFDYASVFGGVQHAAQKLRDRIRDCDADRVHVVGHSLGGLVALEAMRDAPKLPAGRIVCLGSPLRGSAVARRLTRTPAGRWLLGHSRDSLLDGVHAWSGSRAVGVIAGTRPIGLGMALGALDSSNDGTVTIDETRLAGIADHCVVPITHSGLVFSAEVAELTMAFLRDGRFAAAARS